MSTNETDPRMAGLLVSLAHISNWGERVDERRRALSAVPLADLVARAEQLYREYDAAETLTSDFVLEYGAVDRELYDRVDDVSAVVAGILFQALESGDPGLIMAARAAYIGHSVCVRRWVFRDYHGRLLETTAGLYHEDPAPMSFTDGAIDTRKARRAGPAPTPPKRRRTKRTK